MASHFALRLIVADFDCVLPLVRLTHAQMQADQSQTCILPGHIAQKLLPRQCALVAVSEDCEVSS